MDATGGRFECPDGVVFVADSQEEPLDANFETKDNLQEHLKEHNLKFDTIPYVLQLNTRQYGRRR